jgi:alpha-L-fucosidase
MFENRRWLIIPTSLTGSIDFNQVLESSAENLRLSLDGTKTFVKYEINEITASYEEYHPDTENPDSWITSSVEAGVYGRPSIYQEGDKEYTHQEILNVLTGSEWTSNEELE